MTREVCGGHPPWKGNRSEVKATLELSRIGVRIGEIPQAQTDPVGLLRQINDLREDGVPISQINDEVVNISALANKATD